jgi:G:T-mismatch repair DNA endonuclease (very short patch repair protein)
MKQKDNEITWEEKIRRERISETMKERFRKNPSEFDRLRLSSLKRKQKLGYVNSPITRKKLSDIMKDKWIIEDVTEKQKQTLFKKGFDEKRKNPFRKGHEVSLKTREAVKKNRATQIFPKKDSSIEVKIQNYLKELGIEFFTHQYMKEIEHSYQCDVLIPVQKGIERKTIIECFGNYWHHYPLSKEIDIQRCNELREKGWRVLVFWENEIKEMMLNNLQEELTW